MPATPRSGVGVTEAINWVCEQAVAHVLQQRKKLGLDSEPADQRIEELSAKIDALTEAVAKLAASK